MLFRMERGVCVCVCMLDIVQEDINCILQQRLRWGRGTAD